ncbi:MAG: hypothetical protein V4773_10890, partial [Verrucomicrobiota bacterium]
VSVAGSAVSPRLATRTPVTRMPVIAPDASVDYKARIVTPDPNTDFKIAKIEPSEPATPAPAPAK